MTRNDAVLNFGILAVAMIAWFLLAREQESSKSLAEKLSICNATKPDAIQISEPESKPERPRKASRPVITPPDMATLRVGDTLIYASGARSRVWAISRDDEGWHLRTAQGHGCYERYGTDTKGGDNIKGVVR